MQRHQTLASLLALLVAMGAATKLEAQVVPAEINHEGLLMGDNGLPMEGNIVLRLAIYDQGVGGVPLWFEQSQVLLVDGYYSVRLGMTVPLGDVFDGPGERYLGVSIDGENDLLPRHRLLAVPYALFAANAVGDITPASVTVAGRTVIDRDGNVVGQGEGGGDGYETPEQVLAALQEVDGPGSELSADAVDGVSAEQFMRADQSTGTVGSVTVGGDVTAAGMASFGGVRANDMANHTALTLQRDDAGSKAAVRFRTGGSTDWWLFVDDDGADRDLRLLSSGVPGFGDRTPQLQLTTGGDVVAGRNVEAAGELAGSTLFVSAPGGPLAVLRPMVDLAPGQPALVVQSPGGESLLALEPEGGANLPALSGSATGLHVMGGSGVAGSLRLAANRGDSAASVVLSGDRVSLQTMDGAGGLQSTLTALGPSGRVGLGTEAPESSLHVVAQRDDVVLRQSRAGGPSFDLDVTAAGWSVASSGGAPLLRVEGSPERVTVPNLVFSPQAAPPQHPIVGQAYFDTDARAVFIWNGEAWKPMAECECAGGDGGDNEVPHTIDGFVGHEGPDLSGDGFTQCYGWVNDGVGAAPTLAAMRAACGDAFRVSFAGHRCDGTWVRHDALLPEPLSTYLVPEAHYWREFDIDRRYSFNSDPSWLVLNLYGRNWQDPGRLWEPYIGSDPANRGAYYGHVLSQSGNNAHDQGNCTGDAYYVYVELEEQVVEPVRLGLVGHWPLDRSGRDVSGNQLHGRLENGVAFEDGRKGAAARIDANDDAIRVVDAGDSLLDVERVTMAAWVNPASCDAPHDRGIIMNKESVYEFGLEDGTCRLQAALTPCWRWWGSAVVPPGQWTHVAVTFDGANQIHYVNGVEVERTACAGDLATNDEDFKIGSRNGDGANGSDFNGLIDEAYLYGRSLTPEEIQSVMAVGLLVPDAGEPGSFDAPALSCRSVKEEDLQAPSGAYWIDPDLDGPELPRLVYCDQEYEGGGWTVVFHSDDPARWRAEHGVPGVGHWGHDLSDSSLSFGELYFRRVATGQLIKLSIEEDQLYQCRQAQPPTDQFWWDGSTWIGWNARHLGVSSSTPKGRDPGYIISTGSCHNDHVSWGFGHRGWMDDIQGFGWDSHQLADHVFRVAVR